MIHGIGRPRLQEACELARPPLSGHSSDCILAGAYWPSIPLVQGLSGERREGHEPESKRSKLAIITGAAPIGERRNSEQHLATVLTGSRYQADNGHRGMGAAGWMQLEQ